MGSLFATCDLIDAQSQYTGPPIRLAWPKQNDTRRSMVGKSPPRNNCDRQCRDARDLQFVLVSQRDMEMHYSSTDQNLLTLDVPMRWSPSIMKTGEQELLEHFQVSASKALTVFGHDPMQQGDALIRFALARNTASAKALLSSMLAFSSIHRNDVHSQAIELKVDAIEALGVASRETEVDLVDAIQHIATNMLLCSFETHQSTCTSGDWQLYLGSAKQITLSKGLHTLPDRCSDLTILLDWVFYNDVHARFARQYWHRKPHPTDPLIPSTVHLRAPSAGITRMSSPGIILTKLLSEVIDAVSAIPLPTASRSEINKFNEFVKILDWRIRNVTIPEDLSATEPDTPPSLELYRLALLIYLDRTCKSQQRLKTQRQVEEAFRIIPSLKACERQFPVFIIGYEAKHDEQRTAILDLISRTEKREGSRAFVHTPLILQALWAQEDLMAAGTQGCEKLEYGGRMRAVISRCRIMPSFM